MWSIRKACALAVGTLIGWWWWLRGNDCVHPRRVECPVGRYHIHTTYWKNGYYWLCDRSRRCEAAYRHREACDANGSSRMPQHEAYDGTFSVHPRTTHAQAEHANHHARDSSVEKHYSMSVQRKQQCPPHGAHGSCWGGGVRSDRITRMLTVSTHVYTARGMPDEPFASHASLCLFAAFE
jgi:hypothetical protein